MKGLSVVVPVFDSEDLLEELLSRLNPILEATGVPYEVVLVNDGSRDESWSVVRTLAGSRDWVRGFNLMRNYGQHNALLCGIRAARYDVIATLDDDLQHPPEELPKLLTQLAKKEEVDVVYGPPIQEQHGLWRDLSSVITKLALRSAMGVTIANDVCAFRVFRADLRKAFENYNGSFVSIDVLLSWGTSRFSSVRVRHDARPRGQSHYSFRKLLTHALNMMTGFSTMPLQVASVVGFSFTLLGIAFLVYVVARYLLEGGAPPGFPFLASQMAILAGAQLFAIGIIGEYLARIHFRSLDKPGYVVRSEAGRENKSADG